MSEQTSDTGSLTAAILGLTLLGGVLVAYLWDTVNRLLSLQFDLLRVIVFIPILLVFLLLLRFIARRVRGWGGEHERSTSTSEWP